MKVSKVYVSETHGHVVLQATEQANNAIAVAVSYELSIYFYINIT